MKNLMHIWASGLILLTLSGLSLSAAAQETSEIKPSVGFKAGLGISNFRGSDAGELDARLSLTLAGFYTYGTDKLAFQPEIRYAQMGAQFLEWAEEFSYLEISALLKVLNPVAELFEKWLEIDDKGVRMLYVGPVAGIKLSSSSSFGHNLNAKTMVFALAIGADAYWQIGPKNKFYGDVRYYHGISNPYKNSTSDVKHVGLSLMLGLAF